jgi:two-component system, cell cycle response regulator DivK
MHMRPDGVQNAETAETTAVEASTDTLQATLLVLLIEDSPPELVLYRDHLLAAGFRVVTATDGSEGFALALSALPDLIVMDLEMPRVDGWQAARLLRDDERTTHIPIVALSGHHNAAAVMRAIEQGCTCFVPKPCLAAELDSIIRSTLERARRDRLDTSPKA